MSHDHPAANALLATLRGELAAVEQSIRSHHFLDALGADRVAQDRLRAFASEQSSGHRGLVGA